jgi:hypothetical protein
MALLIVATLRSPFLPQAYGALPALWLLTLLAAARWTRLAPVLILWVGLNLYWPLDWPLDPRALAIATLVPQVILVALAALTLKATIATSPVRRSAAAGAPSIPSELISS